MADQPFWSLSTEEMCARLQTSVDGLTSRQAAEQLSLHGANVLADKHKAGPIGLFMRQFKSPLVLILLAAAILSFFLHDATDAVVILFIVVVSGLLSFSQEHGASRAVERLLATVTTKATVRRAGQDVQVPTKEVVPGDVVLLSAGSSIPADCLILESRDLHVDEATLTGESFPVEKRAGALAEDTPLAERANSLFLGTHVVSGTGTALVVGTGRDTEFGAISDRLRLRPPETEFERGIRRFGYLIMEVTLLLVGAIFAVNVYFDRPVLEAFLFSVALAVGLTPQLLPAIISVNLAHGARRMADANAIVRRLASIEDFGSMDILCSDKTGTLTEGVARVHAALNPTGEPSEPTFLHAFLNASFESGFANPVDDAIRRHAKPDISAYSKLDEVPYDFVRKRLSVLVGGPDGRRLVTKGALTNVLAACASAQMELGKTRPMAACRDGIGTLYERYSQEGFRVLGIAYRNFDSQLHATAEDERDMVFLGFLVVEDPPKPDAAETVRLLRDMGIDLKVITGDNRHVAAHVVSAIRGETPSVLSGAELRTLSDEALIFKAPSIDVFAEVEPNQKERVILALKKSGHVVGYMGDGINDASALHAADVGISVDTAADVAKEAADIVLLKKDLHVLADGVTEGRATFTNTLKYVFMATSANFGNMFSMAGASLFLPFLPLLPKQILLTNLLTDLPEMTIATDGVDAELVDRPRRWDIRYIRRFMLVFGLLSSIFDYLTFAVLWFVMRATTEQFRTGWFLESIVSATLIVLIIRTRRPFYKSRPGIYLIVGIAVAIVLTLAIPLTPLAGPLGFAVLPWHFIPVLGGIVALYVLSAEMAKKWFYRRWPAEAKLRAQKDDMR